MVGGLPWQSSGQDSSASTAGARFWSLWMTISHAAWPSDPPKNQQVGGTLKGESKMPVKRSSTGRTRDPDCVGKKMKPGGKIIWGTLRVSRKPWYRWAARSQVDLKLWSESRVKNFRFHKCKVPVGVPDFSFTSKLGLSPSAEFI